MRWGSSVLQYMRVQYTQHTQGTHGYPIPTPRLTAALAFALWHVSSDRMGSRGLQSGWPSELGGGVEGLCLLMDLICAVVYMPLGSAREVSDCSAEAS